MLSELINRGLLRSVAPRDDLTDHAMTRLIDCESQDNLESLDDEEIWTLLFVYGFVACGNQHLAPLAAALTRQQAAVPPRNAHVEMMPYPPRKGKKGWSEKHSRIDLILGDIEPRSGTTAGVEYCPPDARAGWICLVEAKWLSDIATKTRHDCRRNQLARVIETALTLQRHGLSTCVPDQVHVTLLTPERFRTPTAAGQGSRLYFYKFWEYCTPEGQVRTDAVFADIDCAEIPARPSSRMWRYPDLGVALQKLRLHWVTYEQLWEAMPQSPFKQALGNVIAGAARPLLAL